MNGPQVSIIIANWNGRHWLEQCLPTLATQTFQSFEIIVVDNGSEDDSVGWLRREWPVVRLFTQSHNLGFAAANNLGIQQSQAEFVVTLNNDTRAAPTWLEELVAAVTDPDVGMVAAQVRLWQEPNLIDSAGIEVDKAGIAWHRGWRQPIAMNNTACEVFGPSAAAALYRRQMLGEIGCFDDSFFAYYEDVDLAWRARRAGWRCRYSPKAVVWHWHSATAGQQSAFKVYLMSRNKWWTIARNYDMPFLIWNFLFILFYELLAIGYQTISNRHLAALKGRGAALHRMWQIRRQRSATTHPVPLASLTKPWKRHGRG